FSMSWISKVQSLFSAINFSPMGKNACAPRRGSPLRNLRQISPQRRQWELISILMVVDIKVSWKSCAGEFGLWPTAVGVLFFEQILNAHSHAVGVVIAGGHQPDQGPGGL